MDNKLCFMIKKKNIIHMKGEYKLRFIFNRFPTGCCGVTSLMLGAYLYHYYNIYCEYVCGVHKMQSHA